MHILTIAELTIREAQRRRILWVALLMGLLFLAVFGLGQHLILREFEAAGGSDLEFAPNFLMVAGLYATNFLIVIMSVLISVATISQEIDTHVIETMVTKPIHRRDVVLGKWLGFAVLITLYTFIMAGGVLLITWLRAGYAPDGIAAGLGVMALNGIVAMTVGIAGGTRLSTLANGVLAFMLYGIAFVGGWVETIGALLRNETAVNLGIVSSLVMPVEALWRKASAGFQPGAGLSFEAGPFTVVSEPSDMMVVYAVFYTGLVLALGLWSFRTRDL